MLPLLAFAVAGSLWLTLPPNQQTLRIPGLSAPVDITFDGNGVPRIRAASEHDGFVALGFVHARDRMFQMELMRRAASGRLSELLGTPTVGFDRQMRVFGLGRLAQGDAEAQTPETKAALAAYALGVNAWIADRGRFAAMECLFFGRPEPWRPADSLLWARTMGLFLSGNYRAELARLALRDKIPAEMLEELWPVPPPASRPEARLMNTRPEANRNRIVVSPEARRPEPRRPEARRPEASRPDASPDLPTAAQALLNLLPAFPGPFTQPSRASNAWAVDGRWTNTGAPLLAGDPHLAFGFPGLWYLVRIETPGGVLAGGTGPGAPFLIFGHNGHVAWTFTTTEADTQDVFIEPENTVFTTREERIKVRGAPDILMTVRATRHGPVISDLDPTGSKAILAVAMANLRPGDASASGLLALNHAASVEDAGRASAMIAAPVQNLLTADRTKIALFVTGRVPIRRAGDGWAPVPGNEIQPPRSAAPPPEKTGGELGLEAATSGLPLAPDGDGYGWSGFASGPALPRIVAPASGRLINANEPVAPRDFPVFMGRDTFRDWRARRIRALLDANPIHTSSEFASMQVDIVSPYAVALLPRLRVVPGAAQLLRDWDGAMTETLAQPLIFSAWMVAFRDAVLARAGIGPSAANAPLFDFVPFVLSPAGAHWCGGDCAELLKKTLDTTMSSLAARLGPDPAAWRWGSVHQAVFAHPVLRSIPLLGPMTTARVAVPGDGTTLDRADMNNALEAVHGASYRGIYDLADLDRSLFMMAPGQSGNPLSRHARDFLTRWRDGAMVLLGSKPVAITGKVNLAP